MLVSRFAARALARTYSRQVGAVLVTNRSGCAIISSTTTSSSTTTTTSSSSCWFSTDANIKKETKIEVVIPPPHQDDQPKPLSKGQRLVVAVGGNALQRRGERLTIENM